MASPNWEELHEAAAAVAGNLTCIRKGNGTHHNFLGVQFGDRCKVCRLDAAIDAVTKEECPELEDLGHCDELEEG